MSIDLALTLVKVDRNTFQVGTINLSTRFPVLLLTTRSLDEALACIEKEQLAFAYEGLEVQRFTSLKAFGLPSARHLRKDGPNTYGLDFSDGAIVRGSNLHQITQIAQVVEHGDLQIVGFSRQVASGYDRMVIGGRYSDL